MYGGVDRRPAVIVKVADANDVARVIAFARETGLELAVRSGGHSATGDSVVDGGIVLDLSDMKALEIDVDGRTAWAETGLTAVEYTSACAAHGLATGFGDTGSVGIGGITLGGGVGYLVRKHGLTIDDLLAAEVVTADGELHHVDAGSQPDLFWAIRGGGGNFGVATRFQYRLHEVPSFVGGMLILPATADVVAGFIAAAEAAPEELSTIANVMPCPPMPFVPEEHHGELVVFAILAYAGDEDAGERAVAPFRALAEPIADLVKPMPYPEIYPPDDPDYHPLAIGADDVRRPDRRRRRAADRGPAQRLRRVDARGAAPRARRRDGPRPGRRHRVRPPASRIMVNIAAFYEGPIDYEARLAWVTDFAAALRQDDDGAYVNFVTDEGEARVHAAYPGATWDRLAAIKAPLRPDQPVPPQPEHPAVGICGIVLTVGIAVDSNVLIYERIREEVRTGRTPISAIDAGFKRALATILDSNITTFIAAAVLFYVGTGAVRGFAVTLGIGILTTLFTAFTLTRLIVATWVRWWRPQTVPI